MDLRPRYLVIAALLHLALFALLFVSAFFQRPIEQIQIMTAVMLPPPPPPPPKEKPKPPEPTPEPKPKPKPPEPKPPPKPPEPTPEERVADVLKKLNCETIPDLKHEASMRIGMEQQILRSRIADMESRCKKKDQDKKKEEDRQKKLEEDKLKKEEADRLKKEEDLKKKEEERLKKEEEARKKEEEHQKKLDEEQKKKEEQDRKREMAQMLEQERIDREAADAAARKSALEAAALAEANARADANANKELSEWGALVQQKVKRNWSRLPNLSPDLVAKVTITQLPGGQVVDVRIVRSSGNTAYDDSVVKAIQKSDPLPRIADPLAFAKARELVLNFRAKDFVQ